MEWEQKVEMVRLGNAGKQREMQDFVEPLLATIDAQGENMLLNLLEMTPDNIRQNPDFFKKIFELVLLKESDLDFRTGVRKVYLKLLIKQATTTPTKGNEVTNLNFKKPCAPKERTPEEKQSQIDKVASEVAEFNRYMNNIDSEIKALKERKKRIQNCIAKKNRYLFQLKNDPAAPALGGRTDTGI